MDRMVNYIQLAWKLTCILRTYRTCNATVRFSKYKFKNKLLGGEILLKGMLDVTLNIYIYKYKS